jgi:hypothetical protein
MIIFAADFAQWLAMLGPDAVALFEKIGPQDTVLSDVDCCPTSTPKWSAAIRARSCSSTAWCAASGSRPHPP